MPKSYLTPIDLNGLEIQNARVHVLASDPGSPVAGQIWYNSTTFQLKYYNGSTVVALPNALTFRLDQFAAPTASVALNSQKITGLADPTNPGDASTKAYVDATAQGLSVKDPVRVVATTNLTLSGTQTIDGVACIAGDRVLATGQTTGSANGIYVVAAGAWARSTDMDTTAETKPGSIMWVNEGTANGDTQWILTTDAPVSLGTTSLAFTKFAGGTTYSADGSTLTLTGGTFSVNTGYVGQTSITTVGTIGTGTWSATTIAANKGGTGQTSYAVGDLLYASSTSALSKLADVATGNVLISGGTSTAPSYGKVGLTTHVSGTLPIGNGGTGQTTAAAALTALGGTTKYAVSIGDGSSTTITVTHNLGTLDVHVALFANSGGAEVEADIVHATTNTVTVTFAVAPSTNQFRCVVVG